MIMRHKAKGLMVIVTICLVTQGSMQGVPKCLDLHYHNGVSLMQICKEIGNCNGGLQEVNYQNGEKKEDKLRNILIGKCENVWAKRRKIGNATRYWIPEEGLKYFNGSKISAVSRKRIKDLIDGFLQIRKHTFFYCLRDPTVPQCPPPARPPVQPTTPRKATTRTTGRTTGITTANETTTESDDSGDGITIEIDAIILYTVIGVFTFAAALATCYYCGARKKNRQEHSNESSIDRRSHYSRASRSKSMVSKMSRKSGRSMSNVSRSSQKRRKSRRVSSETEDSSSSTSSVDFSKSKQRYDRSSSVSGFATQSSIGIVKDLFKGAKTQRQITESISKKENIVKKENAVKQELENLKKKRRMSKYDRV